MKQTKKERIKKEERESTKRFIQWLGSNEGELMVSSVAYFGETFELVTED